MVRNLLSLSHPPLQQPQKVDSTFKNLDMQICGYDNYRLNTYATYLHLLLSQVRFTIIDCIFFPAFHIIYDIKNFFEKTGIYMDY
jgi:hypothetical protein